MSSSRLVLLMMGACARQPAPEDLPPPPPEPARVDEQSAEMRGVWITRFSWEDEAQLRGILDHVSAVGFNAVFFQVRGNFDAYYASDLEPWAARLTGQLGQDPGWDPLGMVVEYGHYLGLEVHAYMNTYPLWRGEEAPNSVGVPHPLSTHPDWVVVNASGQPMKLNELYVFASPGHPGVAKHVQEVAEDITARYDIDGLHLDYVRYPGDEFSHDPISLQRFAQAGSGADWNTWQQQQVSQLVGQIRESIDIPVSAAVWGIYEDRFGWGGVSEGLHDYFQDSHGWLANGQIDAIAPMIYWGKTDQPGEKLDFSTLLEDHLRASSGRHVYAGVGGEKIDMDQVIDCIEESRLQGAAGIILFDYSLFSDELDRLGMGLFAESSRTPSMPWRTPPG